MNAEKKWPIFFCQVGQRIPIGIKIESDGWHNLLDAHTKFQNDISKYVEKKTRKTSKNPKGAKIMGKIKKKRIWLAKNGSYVEEYTAGHLGTKFVEYIVIYEAMIAKKNTYFWL